MKTRDWLLAKLIETSTFAATQEALTLRINLGVAEEKVAALTQRIAELSPQKQFVVKESSLHGDSAIRTIQSVYSSKGVTTITL